jgi:hypothetical protein
LMSISKPSSKQIELGILVMYRFSGFLSSSQKSELKYLIIVRTKLCTDMILQMSRWGFEVRTCPERKYCYDTLQQ